MNDGASPQALDVIARLAGAEARVTLRVALDCLAALAEAGLPVHRARSTASGVRLGNVRLAESGRARVVDARDGTGGAALLWEVVAARALAAADAPRLHDLVDDVPADIDDLVGRALESEDAFEDAEALCEAVRVACGAALATPEEVAAALALSPAPSPVASVVQFTPQAAAASVVLVAVGAGRDPLERALRAARFDVARRIDATTGLDAARACSARCILFDDATPGGADAFAVRLRREVGAVGRAPLLVLSGAHDTRARFAAGADVCVPDPIDVAHVVAQTTALARAATRLADERAASTAAGPELAGSLTLLPMHALLALLDADRSTGALELESNGDVLTMTFAAGRLADVRKGGARLDGMEALRRVLQWTTGRFSFRELAAAEMTDDAIAIATALSLLAAESEAQVERDGPRSDV